MAVPPLYTVQVGDQVLAVGRDLAALRETIRIDAARQADRTVTLVAGEQRYSFRLSELGMQVLPEAALTQFGQAIARLPWGQRLAWSRPDVAVAYESEWDTSKLEAALAPIAASLAREPVPASLKVINKQPVITPEVVGAAVSTESVLQALRNLGSATEMSLPVESRLPEVTQASLESMRIKRLIAEWSTYYDPSIPRAENVEKAARAFNGLTLKPGEILSYNGTVGPIDTANGWREAYVIVAGELVPGVGGGVCQVATTFYGAALRANLEIMERHPHQLAVTYIDPSQDAAIAQGWEDLKLRNTALGHLLIETEAGGGRVTFRLYGDVPEGQEVKVESKVLGSKPFGTKTVVDPGLPPGRQSVKLSGNPGYSSEAYRVVYRDGREVRRELLSRDSYLPTAQVVLVGPQPQPQAPPPPPQPPADPPSPPEEPAVEPQPPADPVDPPVPPQGD